jgi:hypothetical protein
MGHHLKKNKPTNLGHRNKIRIQVKGTKTIFIKIRLENFPNLGNEIAIKL